MAPVNPRVLGDGTVDDDSSQVLDALITWNGMKMTKTERALDYMRFCPVWNYKEGLELVHCSLFSTDGYLSSGVGVPVRALQSSEWTGYCPPVVPGNLEDLFNEETQSGDVS